MPRVLATRWASCSASLGDDDNAGWTWACGTEGCSSAVQVPVGALLGLLRRLPAFVESVLMHVDGEVPRLGLMGATLEDSISTRRSLECSSTSQVLDVSKCRGHSTGCLAGETPPRPRPVNPPPTQSSAPKMDKSGSAALNASNSWMTDATTFLKVTRTI